MRTDSIQEVVVTGTGTQHLLKDAPVQTEVISHRQLQQFGGKSIEEILSGLASSFDFNENDMGSHLQMNGLGNSYVLILIDGRRLHGDNGGENDLSHYKSQFKGWDVYLSFSSAICINNARAGENVAPKDYYDPEHWLTAIGRAGYRQIVVQSLQVIPGEEYRRVRDTYIKDFMNNRNGDFTDRYMKSLDLNVVVGTPLMAEEEDARNLAIVLNQESDVKAALAEGIVAFMGHGNPMGYDYYGGNIRYLQLEDYLRELNPNYYVGTVDMASTFVDDVLAHIMGGTFTFQVGDMTKTIKYPTNSSKKAQLYPLMSIAGDHAHNDMADPDDEDSWFSKFNEAGIQTNAYETNYTEACWKKYKKGDEYIPALGERARVRALWINHTREAISLLGTEEALSTPTTAPEE